MSTALTVTFALAAWNNVLHLAPRRWRSLIVSIGVIAATAAGTAWSVWLWGTRATGFEHGHAATLWWAATAFTVSSLLVAIGRTSPAMGSLLEDRRIASMGRGEFVRHVSLRIPVVTGLAEEVLFRGVAWAALYAVGGTATALVGTSIAFGIWHVVVSAQQAQREDGRKGTTRRWVAWNVAGTALAGLGFGILRIVTGGIWAPAAVHAAVNLVFAIGARTDPDRAASAPEV